MSVSLIKFRHDVSDGLLGRTIAGTGHRPQKLGGFGETANSTLRRFARAWLEILAPERVISGMALGWDQALAAAAVDLAIPFVAAVPFEGQEARWPTSSQREYQQVLCRAAEVVIVSPGSFSAQSMQSRNEWMTDRCDLLLALYDGSASGTGNCIRYADEIGRDTINLWASWQVLVAALADRRVAG